MIRWLPTSVSDSRISPSALDSPPSHLVFLRSQQPDRVDSRGGAGVRTQPGGTMRTRRLAFAGTGIGCVLLGVATAPAADPAAMCRATKMQRAGAYDLCLLEAAAIALKKGGTPDSSRCDAKFAAAWT